MNFEVELAWAAGLFEGEGSFTCRRKPDGSLGQITMSLTMVDEDVVMRFFRIVGCGNVTSYPYGDKGKTKYMWQTGDARVVSKLYGQFAPFLGARRLLRGAEVIRSYYSTRGGVPE